MLLCTQFDKKWKIDLLHFLSKKVLTLYDLHANITKLTRSAQHRRPDRAFWSKLADAFEGAGEWEKLSEITWKSCWQMKMDVIIYQSCREKRQKTKIKKLLTSTSDCDKISKLLRNNEKKNKKVVDKCLKIW